MNTKPKNTWTADAIVRGDIDAIKKRAGSSPAYLTQRDDYHDTPLMTALAYDHLELVEFLLSQKADPNVSVDDGYTCLLTAIDCESDSQESVSIVKLLIKAGANIHAIGTNGWTPLHMAAARGHVAISRLLIEAGADVNRRKEIDASETPLMEAALMGKPETTRLLLEHGADPAMCETILSRTPLEIARDAAKGPDHRVVECLKQEDIQVDANEVFGDMDLPQDQLAQMKDLVANLDMTQVYIDNAKELAETGDHAAVIQILESHSKRRWYVGMFRFFPLNFLCRPPG